MSMRSWIATALFALAAWPVCAHDFWLQPSPYWLAPQSAVQLTLQVGHGPYRQRSPIPVRRIARFEDLAPDGAIGDLRPRLHLGAAEADADAPLAVPGTHLLVLETDNGAMTSLPAIRFNDYLRAEGLTPALVERERTHRTDRDGAERYRRHAKALVQVGAPGAGGSDAVTRPLGLALEIVPERNPYALPHHDELPVKVLYLGHPLPGALVKLTRLEHDESPVETHRTDAAGRAVFTVPAHGSWLLNVIWTRPLPASDDADFETSFSSLAFGFP
ncbi:DUF4198 domain-containing protein [Dyella sp. SG609]|uniref:DUF4198 domain-containing protein n=1 Tax=Dyella sp. SG609 TaxID=2587018 RepID=UPI00180E75E6|nr:DUF4198 domain-containing protein [Dyella sp. SG609]NKJ19711.1 putative GH25 family protein [Dyella sp. SG609]